MSNAKKLSVVVSKYAVDALVAKLEVEFESNDIEVVIIARGDNAGSYKVSVVCADDDQKAYFKKCAGKIGLAVEAAGSLISIGTDKAIGVVEPAAKVVAKTTISVGLKSANAVYRIGRDTVNETKSGKDWRELKQNTNSLFGGIIGMLGGSDVEEEDI